MYIFMYHADRPHKRGHLRCKRKRPIASNNSGPWRESASSITKTRHSTLDKMHTKAAATQAITTTK